MTHYGSIQFSKLEEEITCSICLQALADPVSITCGHTFCRRCISDYWASPQLLGHRCPECRKVCPRDQLIPAYRLQNVVHLAADKEQNTPAPARAVQLVYTDEQNKMCLDEAVVDKCFLDSEISGYPLCLICVIGEKRRGKSCLLNYTLRPLHRLEKGQPFSLGEQDEPLSGFDWKSGTNSLTKGIWVWDRPFILERNGEKMAVFILDTEGSLDIKSNQETSIKLSGLSMLLSSFLIFNVNSSLKTTELDYLDMYLHVSEVTGESFSLKDQQHLSILIRDWHDSENCGREAANTYIMQETENLLESRVRKTLRGPSVSGYLLPHPGKTFLKSNSGRLSDMDEDFRGHLTNCISDLVGGVWDHCKTDIHGEKITCGHLGQILKDFVTVIQREDLNFTTPVEMFYALGNQKSMIKTIKQLLEFLEKEAPKTSSPFRILGVTPSKMRVKVEKEVLRLLEDYKQNVKGSKKEKFIDETKTQLDQEMEKFCAEYAKRFTKCAVGIGCAVGGGVLALAGGAVGAVVAGTVVAVEASALLGSTAAAIATSTVGGVVALGAIGAGVGAGVGGAIGRNEKKKDQMSDDGGHNGESTSEETQPLLTEQNGQ